MKLLVKFHKDWADEFDVQGYKIFDDDLSWANFIDQLPELEYYFGTNEGWSGDEFNLNDFTVRAITDTEAQTLTQLLGREWGHFPS